jgi:acyl carrier protein
MLTEEKRFRDVVYTAFNSLSGEPSSKIADDATFESLGLDSLAMSQVIFSIEEQLGSEVSDEALERMANAETVGDLWCALMSNHSEAEQ